MEPTDTMANNFLSPTCTCSLLLSESLKSAQTPRTSRVHDLLRNNHPPCQAELADLRNVIEQAPQIIREIDQRIARVTEILAGLSSARNQAESHLADAKSLLHPIRSLPNEILHEIFTYCVPTWEAPSELDHVDSLHSRFAPWTLARVCHSWRALAISSPLLWTYFQFDASLHAGISRQKCADKVSLYLERSRDLSLSINLIDVAGRTVDHPVFPALKLAMSRCKHLGAQASTRCLQALSGTVFSRLSLLAVTSAHIDRHRVEVDTFNSVSAPKLRAVLSHDPFWESMKYVSIPWPQISVVYKLPLFDNISLQRLRDIPDIQFLTLTVLRSCIPPETAIPLRKLAVLTMTEGRDAEPGCVKGLMSALVLDALSSLCLKYLTPRRLLFPTTGVFADKLSTLTIKCTTRGHPDNTQNLLQFLSLFPRVRSLNLEDNPLEGPFIIGLRYSSTASLRLPRLRYLDISKCPFTPATDLSAVFDMLESRCRDVSHNASTSEAPSSSQRVFLRKLRVPLWLSSQEDDRWRGIKIRKGLRVELG